MAHSSLDESIQSTIDRTVRTLTIRMIVIAGFWALVSLPLYLYFASVIG